MMIYPPIDILGDKAGNKYALSVLAAKRARQLNQGAEPLVAKEKIVNEKSIGIAALEIYEDKIVASEE